MTDKTKSSQTITWGKRLVLVVIILAGMFYGVLNLAERSKDSIRLGLQDYLSQSTGHVATITDMTTVELSPDMVFKMSGIVIQDKDDSKKTLVSVKKAYIAMPFWRMIFGSQKYIGLEVQNLDIASGYILPQKISISFAGISDPSPDKTPPSFLIDGLYNKKPVLVTLQLDRKKANRYFLYSFPLTTPFTFKIGNLESDGIISRGFSGVSLKQVQLTLPKDRAEFVLNDVVQEPISGNFEGTINDVPVNGLLTKLDDIVTLAITPKSYEKKELEAINRFISAFKDEIGLNKAYGFDVIISGRSNEKRE